MSINIDLYQKGLAVRKEVMGEEFVDSALNSSSGFARALQEVMTENAWGNIWTRGGISKKTRSLITISILISLRASSELKGHLRGALRNGCSVEEIQETMLHASAYCGFPAVNEAFKVAGPIFVEFESIQD